MNFKNVSGLLFAVVLAQQAIGLIGESYLLSTLSIDHFMLRASITRFITFDAFGLIIMGLAFVALMMRIAYLKRQS